MAWWSKLGLGQRVDRAEAALPQGGAGSTLNLFNIVGGRVLMTSIIGEVGTVAIGVGPNNSKLKLDASTGSDRDLCADLDIDAYGIGEVLGITGINTDTMIPPTPGYGSVEGMTVPVVLQDGALALECDGGAILGKIKWTLHYIPIDDGAYVQAVAIP